MSQQPSGTTPTTTDPELEILLVEDNLMDLQGRVVTEQNNLYAAQKLRDKSDPGSAAEEAAEAEIDQICSNIDTYNEEIERLEAERRKLQLQISDRLRGR
ncbi:MAG: hypothetical protein U0516_02830 [Candidatus Saccharibacteria bacterium]